MKTLGPASALAVIGLVACSLFLSSQATAEGDFITGLGAALGTAGQAYPQKDRPEKSGIFAKCDVCKSVQVEGGWDAQIRCTNTPGTIHHYTQTRKDAEHYLDINCRLTEKKLGLGKSKSPTQPNHRPAAPTSGASSVN